MAILRNCEIWFAKLNPKRPSAKFNKENPTWEIQLRTDSYEQKVEWEALGLKPKLMTHKGGEQDGEPLLNEKGKKQWRMNLRKKSIKQDGEAAPPVKVVNGHLEEIDPLSIGNGSVGNIRIFQYEYNKGDEKGVATVLISIQLTKHIVYKPKPMDDPFDMVQTETIELDEQEQEDDDNDDDVETSLVPKAPPSAPNPSGKPDEAF